MQSRTFWSSRIPIQTLKWSYTCVCQYIEQADLSFFALEFSYNDASTDFSLRHLGVSYPRSCMKAPSEFSTMVKMAAVVSGYLSMFHEQLSRLRLNFNTSLSETPLRLNALLNFEWHELYTPFIFSFNVDSGSFM